MSDRIWTVPNALSFLRIGCVPAFLVLLAQGDDGLAFVALAVSGVTDFFDGWFARRYRQVSRLGQVLDPLADRLFIVSTVVALALRQIVPWWLVAVILLRDVVGTAVIWSLRRVGYRTLASHFLGKAATFCLLWALPLLLLAHVTRDSSTQARSVALSIGWAFAWWGAALSWVSMVAYLLQARHLLREATRSRTGGTATRDASGTESARDGNDGARN